MSVSSNEKSREDSVSLDDDSGLDSVPDDIQSPTDDRERIAHLETAVTWIRNEVAALKLYDRDILQELWKVRSGINEIRDTQKQQKEAESKYLEDSVSDRSTSPTTSGPLLNHSDRERSQSLSPPPEPITAPTEGLPFERSSTLELMKRAPHHLKKKSDDQVLQEFFGTDQVDKLKQFKSNMTMEESEGQPTEGEGEGGQGSEGHRVSHGSPHSSSSHNSSPLINHALNGVKLRNKHGASFKDISEDAKLKMPITLTPGTDRLRASYDVASEMEKLRLRLQENTLNELAELDKKYSPKFSHPGFTIEEGAGGNHSRQGSLDSSIPATTQLSVPSHGHVRQYSLPVNMIDPSVSGGSRVGELTQPRSGSLDHVHGGRETSRSPTPPLQYGHVRQVSGGSASSGSGTFSPPPHASSTSPHHESPLIGQIVAPPPPSTHGGSQQGRRSRPSSAGGRGDRTSPSGNAGSNGVGSMSRGRSANQTSNGNVPSYSTYVVKRKRNSLEKIENGKHQVVRNGYPPSNPSTHHHQVPSLRLQPSQPGGYNKYHSSSMTDGVDQPEQKSLPWNPFNKIVSGKVGASPKLSRASSSPRRDTMPAERPAPTGKPHTYLVPRKSEPSIYPEDIQPYMSSNEVKAQMPFEYVPFSAQNKRGGGEPLPVPMRTVGRKSDSNVRRMPENTWC